MDLLDSEKNFPNYFKIKKSEDFIEEASYKNRFYLISIQKSKKKVMSIYDAKLLIESTLDYLKLKNEFLDYLKENFLNLDPGLGFIKLEKLLELIKDFFFQTKKIHYSVIPDINDQIILFWGYISGLIKLLPLLFDQNIEEIFISPNSEVVTIDHFQYGRMATNILISSKEKDNFLYRTAMENNLEINQLQPSIKGDIQIKNLCSLRITGDITPFSYDGTILNIRKLHQREFNLITLIKLHSIDAITCAYIKTIISLGVNFTIIGSPSSGKTTLQNALLREMPEFWRIFSFENTLETNIKKSNYFRFKIYDYLKSNYNLTEIFSQLLHRSPDFVNLGEITTKEEALAWNACMSAGIPIIQTIHSNSSEGLLSRITKVFEIPVELLASSLPHIVIEVKYFWNNFKKERKVFSLSEFILNNQEILELNKLAEYDFELRKIVWIDKPEHSKTIEWLKKNKYSQIDYLFQSNLKKYQDI